jgi:hypothetical protein
MDKQGRQGLPLSPSKWIATGCSDLGATSTFVTVMVRGPTIKSSAFIWSDFGASVAVMSIRKSPVQAG